MPTYEIPDSLAARLPERSVIRFRTYVPTAPMPLDLWERVRLDLIGLVADTAPPSDTDARTVLATLCAFYAWATEQFQEKDIRCLLTDDRRLAYEAAHATKGSAGTRQNRRGRLNRCLRALAGEPATTRRQERAPSAEPYRTPELEKLLIAARCSEPLARVLAVALASGKAGQQGVGRPIPDSDDLDAAIGRLGVNADGELLLARTNAGPLADDDWTRARASARRAGRDIATDRLRVTWALAVMTEPTQTASLIRSHGVSRRDLDNIVRHLTVPDGDATRTYLRGA